MPADGPGSVSVNVMWFNDARSQYSHFGVRKDIYIFSTCIIHVSRTIG